MSLTCNAVGDVLALIKLAIDIAKFLNECRGAPAECRALCNELRSLERLLALSKPTILVLRDEGLRELVKERLQIVSAHIEEGLNLIVKFRSAFDVPAAARPDRSWRTTSLRWATKALQSIDWTLRKSTNAKACRLIIAQSFEPLIFSLLVVFQADQKAVLEVLQDAFTDLADEVRAGYTEMRGLAVGQEMLQEDILFLKQSFNQHLVALQSVREEVSSLRTQFADILAATSLDIADVRRRLEAFCSTAATSADLYSTTQTVVDTVAQESTSTRVMLETFFVTIADDRLAGYEMLARMDSKLDQVVKLLEQQGVKESTGELVQHHRFFGMQQLRIASVRVQEFAPLLLPVISRAVTSDEAITVSITLAMMASSSTERVAYGVTALLLVVAQKACQLYKVPVVVHIVFVEDFFGVALEIPAYKCSNPQDFHTALIGKFEGRMGIALIRRRKYELQLIGSPMSTRQALPWTWERPLEPGALIHMNTYVQRLEPGALSCPACSTQVTNPGQSSALNQGWVACPKCPAKLQLSHRDVTHGPRSLEPPPEPTTEVPSRIPDPSCPSTSSLPTLDRTLIADDSEEQDALRLCRRIHVIQQTIISPIESSQVSNEAVTKDRDEKISGEDEKILPHAPINNLFTVDEIHSAVLDVPSTSPSVEPAPFGMGATDEVFEAPLTRVMSVKQDLAMCQPRTFRATPAAAPSGYEAPALIGLYNLGLGNAPGNPSAGHAGGTRLSAQRDFLHADNPIEMRGFTNSDISQASLEIYYRPQGIMFRKTNPLHMAIASRRESKLYPPGDRNLRHRFTLSPLHNKPAPVSGTASITREWVARPSGGPPAIRFVLRYNFSARLPLPQGGYTSHTISCAGKVALP